MTEPDWLVPDARVAYLVQGSWSREADVRFLTIERLTPKQVVASDGSRWWRDTLERIASQQFFPPKLRSALDPEVIEVADKARRRRVLRAAAQDAQLLATEWLRDPNGPAGQKLLDRVSKALADPAAGSGRTGE